MDKMNRRNIPFKWICLEYCDSLLTKNFEPKAWLQIVLNIFNDFGKSPEILLMTVVVYLCSVWQEQLKNCYKLEEFQYVL